MVVYSSKFRLGGDVSTSSRRYIAGSSEDIHKEREEQKGLYTLLSQKNSTILEQYIKSYKPGYWLFEEQMGGYNTSSSFQKRISRSTGSGQTRQTVNGDYSAIRMLYTKVLIRGGEPPRPRREKILPTVL